MTTLKDLSMHRGESKVFDLYFTDVNGAALSLTGATVVFEVSTNPGTTIVLTRSSPGSGIVIDADQVTAGHKGHATLSLAPGDTAALPLDGYDYKAKVTESDGFVSVGSAGLFTLRE
jgi:hypothetical protein